MLGNPPASSEPWSSHFVDVNGPRKLSDLSALLPWPSGSQVTWICGETLLITWAPTPVQIFMYIALEKYYTPLCLFLSPVSGGNSSVWPLA